jgi:hypothetical protein
VRAAQSSARAASGSDTAYVASFQEGKFSILGFPASTSGSVSAFINISGPLTGVTQYIGYLASDAAGDLYALTQAADLEGEAIEEFPPGANGNVAPSRVLNVETATAPLGPGQPPQALHVMPFSIAADSKGDLYVAAWLEPPAPFTSFVMAVLVYAAGANGDDAPAKILDQQFVSTPLYQNNISLAVNASDDLYVAQKTGTTNAFASEYSPFGTGNKLLATSTSSWGPGYGPGDIAVGPVSGTVYACVGARSGDFFVAGNAQLTKILGYIKGNGYPDELTGGEFALDSSDEVFTFAIDGLEVFRASANGTAPEIRNIDVPFATPSITIVHAPRS